MSCQDCVLPLPSSRSSNRRGAAGGAAGPRPVVTAGVVSVGAPPRPPLPPRPPPSESIWYTIQRESDEKDAFVALGIATSWLDSRLTTCSTGFASVGSVFVNRSPYTTHLPSAEICAPSMPRHRA